MRKGTDAGDREMEIFATDGGVKQIDGLLAIAGFWWTTEVKYDFDQLLQLRSVRQRFVHR